MPDDSSDSNDQVVLLNGAMSPNPFVTAFLRVGDNDPGGSSQFGISAQRQTVHGQLVWDPDHRRNGLASRFFSVVPVRFHLKPEECLLSVGTGDYLRTLTAPYRWVEKIQIGAIAGTDTPGRAIIWDFIEIDFGYAGGRTETHRSCCLPRVATGGVLRQSAQCGDRPRSCPQQFAEIATRSREIVEIKIRGQVTLRANDAAVDAICPLLAEDLQGRIQVFTDATAERNNSANQRPVQ